MFIHWDMNINWTHLEAAGNDVNVRYTEECVKEQHL